jgi:hypothetical protein
MMTRNKKINQHRRDFLRKFTLLGGIGAAGTLTGSAAVHWLRTSVPAGNGARIRIEPDPSETGFAPLQQLKVCSSAPGTLVVFDGGNREYFRDSIRDEMKITTGGGPGNQLLILLDETGKPVDFANVRVRCTTSVNDSSGKYRRLLDNLYYTMTNEWEREAAVVRFNDKYYHQFVSWLRDHVHTMKGMKYFYHELKTGIELYADSQREDGMIWDNYNKRPPEGDYWEQRFDYGGFVRVVDDGLQEFRRIPVENDVEYLFIEGIYYTWKACGDDAWMERMLDPALKALEYSTTDPYRWSGKYRLLKRGHTIDTWDFQDDEDATISAGPGLYGDPMVIRLPYTRFGVMFGDNTGMFASCTYLAEMLDHAGRAEEAARVRETGRGIGERLDALSWNGAFYTHHVPEDRSIVRDLGVDESKQVSLSNAYSINRMIGHERAVSIIRTYMDIRKRMPSTSPGEWYTIFPPFEKGYGGHNSKWSYMNGGVTSIVAGELAHGAFEHGFESYGVDILDRLLALSGKTGGFLHCTYRGAMEPPPERTFVTLSLKDLANADLRGDTVEGVAGWTGEGENDLHQFPAGEQVFHGVPFLVTDPAQNGRKACLGMSGERPYADHAVLKAGRRAASVYILHTTGRNYYAGSISLDYADGSSHIDHMGPGKISNWWYPTAPEDRTQMPRMKIAWRGENKYCRNVGVSLYGLDNPHPDRKIESITFRSAGDRTRWMVLGVTLSDQPVWLRPDFVSTGIPDNWGAAAVVYALVEGLCGIKDRGTAFSHALISPRWQAAREKEASVTVTYPASGGYVSYRYRYSGDAVKIDFTGSMEQTDLRLLLPGDVTPSQVWINGNPVEFATETIEQSRYLVVTGIRSPVNRVEVEL